MAPKREGGKNKLEEVYPFDDLLWVWNGFWRLSSSRPIAMSGPTRLPPSEVLAYATLQCWASEKTQDFSFFVDVMDAKFMDFVEEEQEKQRKEQEKKQKQSGPKRR